MSNIMSADATPERENDGTRSLHTVHVRFAHTQGRRLRAPTAAENTGDASLWVERPLLMQRADGSYDLVGTTARLGRLVPWILSHGTAATVVGPERLQHRVACEARRVWEHYHEAES